MEANPWVDSHRLEVGGSAFVASLTPMGVAAGEFVIVKPPGLVRRYLSLLDDERPRTIVELGIKDGGSTALLALAAEPDLLLALDLEPTIPAVLADLIETRGLQRRLVTAFGLDQSDRGAVTRFVDSHMPEGGFDLIIDDASHILGPTRTSFEVLFPRLRPGGLYVVEDWSSECTNATNLARLLPDTADFSARLAAVNQVVHILNSPDHDLPDAARDSLIEAAALARRDTTDVPADLFELIVEAAGRADLTSLEDVSLGRGRPLADLAVELMMISATNPGVVGQVCVDGEWLTARRGGDDLPLDGFRLDGAWTDFFGYLPESSTERG